MYQGIPLSIKYYNVTLTPSIDQWPPLEFDNLQAKSHPKSITSPPFPPPPAPRHQHHQPLIRHYTDSKFGFDLISRLDAIRMLLIAYYNAALYYRSILIYSTLVVTWNAITLKLLLHVRLSTSLKRSLPIEIYWASKQSETEMTQIPCDCSMIKYTLYGSSYLRR